MKVSADNVSLIQALSDAPGASGFEDEVLKIVRNAAKEMCRFEEDKLRNLYLYRLCHRNYWRRH